MNMQQGVIRRTERVKVLLVDDHQMVREGLRAMLSTVKDIEVVAEASNGLEAIDKVNELQPHVILMDLLMPELGGVEAIRRIKSQHPSVAIIAITFNDKNHYIVDAIRAGAVGCLLKDVPRDLLIHTVRAVHRGGKLPKRGLLNGCTFGTDNAFGNNADKPAKSKPEDTAVLNQLTRRERDVLRLLVLARSNRQIADELYLSEHTATNYTRTLMMKLGVSNRTQAAVKGISSGIADNLSTETRG